MQNWRICFNYYFYGNLLPTNACMLPLHLLHAVAYKDINTAMILYSFGVPFPLRVWIKLVQSFFFSLSSFEIICQKLQVFTILLVVVGCGWCWKAPLLIFKFCRIYCHHSEKASLTHVLNLNKPGRSTSSTSASVRLGAFYMKKNTDSFLLTNAHLAIFSDWTKGYYFC